MTTKLHKVMIEVVHSADQPGDRTWVLRQCVAVTASYAYAEYLAREFEGADGLWIEGPDVPPLPVVEDYIPF